LKQLTRPALAVVISYGLYLLATSAFYPLDFLSVFDTKRLLQLILFAAVMVFTLSWTPLRAITIAQLRRLSPLSRASLAVFFLLGIASSLRLSHPAYALVDVSMLLVMVILIAVTAGSRELAGRHFDQWAVLLLAAVGFAVAIQEFMGFVVGWVLGSEFNYNQALVHFAHPRFYNQLQTWSIPVIAALPWIFPGKRWVRFGCIALLGLQWFLVMATAARGTVVSLLAAMAFIALWLPELRRFWMKYQLAGLLAGIVLYAGILLLNSWLIPPSQAGEFFARSVGRPLVNTSGRSTLWRLSVEDAIKHPLLGAGPTRYACDSDSNIILPAHPHSFPLRILGEWGIIALLLVLVVAITIALGFLKNLKYPGKTGQTDPPLQAILATSLIAGAIHSGLSGLLIMPASQVAMILTGGWTLSLVGKSPQQTHRSVAANYLLVGVMLLAFAQLGFAIREIPRLPVRTNYSESYGPMMPRFWQDGRVCEYTYTEATRDTRK